MVQQEGGGTMQGVFVSMETTTMTCGICGGGGGGGCRCPRVAGGGEQQQQGGVCLALTRRGRYQHFQGL